MPYKIPGIPSAEAHKEETADFWEVQAVRNPGMYISSTQISKIISKELDEIYHEGIESEDDVLDNDLEDVLLELQSRPKYSSSGYPFDFGKFSVKLTENDGLLKDIYLFLLLCTRFNMTNNKVHGGVDGTLLLLSSTDKCN